MIIWLASYPKSGNTWVRLFLNSLLYEKEDKVDINNIQIQQFPNKKHFVNIVDDLKDIKKTLNNSLNAQYKINLDNKVKIFKTHSALWKSEDSTFTNNDNTLGVIHIVRDPRNIITSIKNHYGKDNYKEALNFMKDEKKFIGSKKITEEFDIPTLISSWSNHYKSWKKFKKNYLLIKYENLLENPKFEFLKITEFLKKIGNFNFKSSKIEKTIINSDFKYLKAQEDQNGFVEAPKNQFKKFFFLGPKNNWKNLLDENIKKEVETNFKKYMEEIGYL